MRTIVLALLLLLSSSVVMADEAMMEQCLTQLESCDKKVNDQTDLINDYKDDKALCKKRNEADATQITELEAAVKECKALNTTREKQIANLNEALKEMTDDRDRQKALLDKSMGQLERCIDNCVQATPFWLSAKFYIGLGLGFLIGLPF